MAESTEKEIILEKRLELLETELKILKFILKVRLWYLGCILQVPAQNRKIKTWEVFSIFIFIKFSEYSPLSFSFMDILSRTAKERPVIYRLDCGLDGGII